MCTRVCVCVSECVLLSLSKLTSCPPHSDLLSNYRKQSTSLREAPGETVADPDVEDADEYKSPNDLQDKTGRYSATDSMKLYCLVGKKATGLGQCA